MNNATDAALQLGGMSRQGVHLVPVVRNEAPGAELSFRILHRDACGPTAGANITTNNVLGMDGSGALSGAIGPEGSANLPYVSECESVAGGVAREGALAATANVLFDLRQAVYAVRADLNGSSVDERHAASGQRRVTADHAAVQPAVARPLGAVSVGQYPNRPDARQL